MRFRNYVISWKRDSGNVIRGKVTRENVTQGNVTRGKMLKRTVLSGSWSAATHDSHSAMVPQNKNALRYHSKSSNRQESNFFDILLKVTGYDFEKF
jgi:hypothetical protein